MSMASIIIIWSIAIRAESLYVPVRAHMLEEVEQMRRFLIDPFAVPSAATTSKHPGLRVLCKQCNLYTYIYRAIMPWHLNTRCPIIWSFCSFAINSTCSFLTRERSRTRVHPDDVTWRAHTAHTCVNSVWRQECHIVLPYPMAHSDSSTPIPAILIYHKIAIQMTFSAEIQ